MYSTLPAESLYKIVGHILKDILPSGGSLFTPDKSIWGTETIDDLYERFVNQPDESSDSFLEKLERQLAEAPDDTIQLAGELLYLHLLAPANTHGETKRNLINQVLGWAKNEVSIPEELSKALEPGIAGTGVAFNTYRPHQLWFLLDFARAWKRLDTEQRLAALEDPWKFKALVDRLPITAAYTQREALLNFAHPQSFESIVSRSAKQRIAKRFSDYITEPTQDVDKQLLQIRKRLSEEKGSDIDFYDPGILEAWQPDSSKWGQFIYWVRRFYERDEFEEQERTYKLDIVRTIEALRRKIEAGAGDWSPELKEALADPPNNLLPWQVKDQLLKWAESDRAAAGQALKTLWAPSRSLEERFESFDSLLPRGFKAGRHMRATICSFFHMVVDPTDFPIYRLTPFKKAYELVDFPVPPKEANKAAIYQHALSFLDRISEEASSRGLEILDRLDAQGTLWAVVKTSPAPEFLSKEEKKSFMEFRGGPPQEENGEGTDGGGETSNELEGLAKNLHFPVEYLERINKLLDSKKQLIFHGPPGTGKTYVAKELAKYLSEAGGRHEVVQFHPSYAYEDFVEGYRPTLLEGRPGFALKEGPLKRIAREAAAEPGMTFVLVIDEINRGNVAKVFGELYFLLEYRREEITLQYSDDQFALPDNLLVIGTMNTADRSIALVDSALRRRFHFVPFFPDEPPIQGLLQRWLEKNKSDFLWVAEVVDRANEQLQDRHTAIGPSHFMRLDLTEEWVELIWEHSVLPYLQEQFFGEEERLEDFQLALLRNKKETPVETPADDEADSH